MRRTVTGVVAATLAVIGVVAATLAVIGLAACGDDDGSSSNDGFDVDVSSDLPDDFPVDAVPLPDGELTTAATVGGAGDRSWTLSYESDDPTAAAVRYRDELTRAGFIIEESLANDAGALESFVATGTGYVVNAFAGEVPGGTGSSGLSVSVARR